MFQLQFAFCKEKLVLFAYRIFYFEQRKKPSKCELAANLSAKTYLSDDKIIEQRATFDIIGVDKIVVTVLRIM